MAATEKVLPWTAKKKKKRVAGDGTRVANLEGWGSTIELHPQLPG